MTPEIEAKQSLKDGTPTKPLWIKHLSIGDWALIDEIRYKSNNCTIADAIRSAIRNYAQVLG